MSANVAVLQALREQIRAIEGVAPVARRREACGVASVDCVLGGLPTPGLVELCGPPGAGVTRLVAALVARWTRLGQRVAWVDARWDLYPPGLAQHGVCLSRLLVVRPPAGADRLGDWAVEQLLRIGAFAAVVVARVEPVGGARGARGGHGVGPRWAQAAEHGGCTGIVLNERPDRQLPADVRLAVADGALTVLRDRAGVSGRSAAIPTWPDGVDPWA